MARRAYNPDDPDALQRDAARGDNRAALQLSADEAFAQDRERVRQKAISLGLNPDSYSAVPYWYDPAVLNALGDRNTTGAWRGIDSINPDGSVSIDQLRQQYKGSGAEFEGIPFDQWLAGPSSPWRLNASGTAATYDQSKQTYYPSYNPADTGLDAIMGKVIPGLAIAGMGAGLLGEFGIGPLAGGNAGVTDFATSFVNPEAAAGESLFNTAPVNLASSGGINFADSYLPTLTAGGGAASTVGPLSSLADIAGVLGSGGSLISSGLGGLEGALGSGLLGGATSGLGALTDILQTGGQGALELGTGGAGLQEVLKNVLTNSPASTASKFLKDNLGIDVNPNTLDLLGNLLGTGLGVYGANKQADATKDLYDRFFSLGQPYRDSLASLNANPESFYSSPMVQGALQQGSDALARSLSAEVGNPILNPTALQEMQNYTTRGLLDAFNNRFSQLASAGQLGVSQAAPLGSQAVGAQAGVPNALGAGLASVLGNQRDYTGEFLDLLRNRGGSGLSLV